MRKMKTLLFELLLLLIITAPSFLSLLNNSYFSMHDDQQIARLYLLDQGIRQGYLYPRWVDGLGFGFGYPLYNFYPPLIYYIGVFFHLLGFSYIWSIKLVFILGFYLGSVGVFLLMKRLVGRAAGFLSAALFTFFFYHAVLVYVRGALAEFFSFSLLPFLLLSVVALRQKPTIKKSLLFGVVFGLFILTHPLIAFPAVMFLGFIFLFYFLLLARKSFKEGAGFLFAACSGVIIGLAISSFFWLPSLVEKNFTLTNTILTGELADYKLHFIYPQQFFYSLWGYGGSAKGLADGMTFQLGKIHLVLVLASVGLSIWYFFKKRLVQENFLHFYFFLFLLAFSLFMTTEFSSPIWDKISYLWYLQFPWRFLTFTGVFISIVGGYFIFFVDRLLQLYIPVDWYQDLKRKAVLYFLAFSTVVLLIFIYSKYFKPQKYLFTSDKERTSLEEVSWRISRTSFEFVPKGVKTKKTDLNTTTLAIEKKDLPKDSFKIVKGRAKVKTVKNTFQEKVFEVNASTRTTFRLNTYYFPGWKAFLNESEIAISDKNALKLITVELTKGSHNLKFIFEDTPVRSIAKFISFLGFLVILMILLSPKFKEING